MARTYIQHRPRGNSFRVVTTTINFKRFLSVMVLGAVFSVTQEKGPAVPVLTPGQSIERELKSGETQPYEVRIAQGEFVQLSLDPRGIGVDLTLSTADGKSVGERGSGSRLVGVVLSYIAGASGAYVLKVTGEGSDDSGRYVLKLEGPRAATDRDKKSAAAQRILWEGMKLSDKDTKESQQSAIEKLKEALSNYRQINDRRGEAAAIWSIGSAYYYIGEYEEALAHYHQALLIKRELKDETGEAAVEIDLSFAHFNLDQFDKARIYMEQALAIYRKLNDKKGESEALTNLNFIRAKLNKTVSGADQRKSPAGPAKPKDQGPATTPKGDQKTKDGSKICSCRTLICNANGCWWHYYYCYC